MSERESPRVVPNLLIKKNEPKAFVPISGDFHEECPACGKESVTYESDYPSHERPFGTARVLYCSACGLGFVPGFGETLQTYYKTDYASTNRKDRDDPPEVYFSKEYRAASPTIKRYFSRAVRQGRLLRAHGASFASVLDFGSGPGYFLFCSKAAQKFAFEPDEASRKYLDWMGATSIPSMDDIKENQFHTIVASHSIEHLVAEELQSTLSKLIKALRPGGRFLIEVPQGGHSYLHLAGARQDPHTLFFTPEALSRAVERAGGTILFQEALAKVEIPRRKVGIYSPSDHTFFNANRGSLALICTRDTK